MIKAVHAFFQAILLLLIVTRLAAESVPLHYWVNSKHEFQYLPEQGRYQLNFLINTEEEETFELAIVLQGADPQSWQWPADVNSYHWTPNPHRIIDGQKGSLENYFPVYLRQKVPNILDIQQHFSSKDEWHDVLIFQQDKERIQHYQQRRLLEMSANQTEKNNVLKEIQSNIFGFAAAVTGGVSLVLLTVGIPVAIYVGYRWGKSAARQNNHIHTPELGQIDLPYRSDPQLLPLPGIIRFPFDNIQPGACQQAIPMNPINVMASDQRSRPDNIESSHRTREAFPPTQRTDFYQPNLQFAGENYFETEYDEQSSPSLAPNEDPFWYLDSDDEPARLCTDV
ncbi:hypothetical protein [Endozoicomonas numazuensis]|uniref:Uncharacterized protein n=1 Tax=Endozoicomonas numazuensis TaxID=1137799 RepID=A0A081NI39_9GAMM|nr:hypothetical protein [Endozoicomonas numazuensis]KEQ18112.1 hypothetical protein GZ78_11125 [Endozoicomonas numazuensis]